MNSLLTVWLVHLGVAIAPGVNFALLTQTAGRYGRRPALVAAFGIVTAAATWLVAAVVGLAAVVESSATLFKVVRFIGAGYLIWLGAKRIFHRSSGAEEPEPTQGLGLGSGVRLRRHYANGFITNLGNPKSALFYSSLFAAAFPADASLWLRVGGAGLCWMNTVVIHGSVATLMSSGGVRSRYERVASKLDRVFGVMFIGFGIKLLRTSR